MIKSSKHNNATHLVNKILKLGVDKRISLSYNEIVNNDNSR